MSNCLTLTEIEALAAIDGIELERGETAELQPVIAVFSTTGMSPSGMRRCCRPRVIAKSDTRAGCRRRKRTPTTRSSAARGRVLSGLKVRIKDNIAVAGVPTTNGSRLRSYTPDEDVVVVERSLAAGVTVAAKLNMVTGAEPASERRARSAQLEARSIPFTRPAASQAVRARQSARARLTSHWRLTRGSGIPAAFCGVCAMKPTHGLVPSKGILHIDHTIDAITPVCQNC